MRVLTCLITKYIVLVCLKSDPKLQFCRPGLSDIGKLGYASLTVWNMRTWKAMVCDYIGSRLYPSAEFTTLFLFLTS